MNALRKTRLRKDEELALFRLFAGSGAVSMLAAVLMVLYRRGWHKEDLIRLYEDIRIFMRMDVFGRKTTNGEAVDYVRQKLGIDIAEIQDDMEFEVS